MTDDLPEGDAPSLSPTPKIDEPPTTEAEGREPNGSHLTAEVLGEPFGAGYSQRSTQPIAHGWNRPLPAEIPESTWVPSALAFGITLLFWGVATSPIVSGVGLLAIFIALGFWIGEMCSER